MNKRIQESEESRIRVKSFESYFQCHGYTGMSFPQAKRVGNPSSLERFRPDPRQSEDESPNDKSFWGYLVLDKVTVNSGSGRSSLRSLTPRTLASSPVKEND
jgi:hypothetical protein